MSDALEALMQEGRTFPPPGEFRKTALDTDATVYEAAERDWQGFWAQQALDLAYNCLDRHVEAGHADQVAFHWEGEPGDTRSVSYGDLLEETCRVANAL